MSVSANRNEGSGIWSRAVKCLADKSVGVANRSEKLEPVRIHRSSGPVDEREVLDWARS